MLGNTGIEGNEVFGDEGRGCRWPEERLAERISGFAKESFLLRRWGSTCSGRYGFCRGYRHFEASVPMYGNECIECMSGANSLSILEY